MYTVNVSKNEVAKGYIIFLFFLKSVDNVSCSLESILGVIFALIEVI